MKKLLFLSLALLLFGMVGSASAQSIKVTPRDSINAAERYSTIKIDSILNVSTMQMRADSSYQGDNNPKVQLQIDVAVSEGRIDTIIVEKRSLVALDSNRVKYDTLWRPVGIMKLSDASVDTLGVISQGPFTSTFGKTYRTESFLVYDAFMDGSPWRIRRASGAGHPIFPDNSCTHTLYFEIHRRDSYTGGR